MNYVCVHGTVGCSEVVIFGPRVETIFRDFLILIYSFSGWEGVVGELCH